MTTLWIPYCSVSIGRDVVWVGGVGCRINLPHVAALHSSSTSLLLGEGRACHSLYIQRGLARDIILLLECMCVRGRLWFGRLWRTLPDGPFRMVGRRVVASVIIIWICFFVGRKTRGPRANSAATRPGATPLLHSGGALVHGSRMPCRRGPGLLCAACTGGGKPRHDRNWVRSRFFFLGR